MTTTIHADGPLSVGTPYANTPTTVLHVLVVEVFVLSLVAAFAAMVVVAFAAFYGRGGWCIAWRECRWWASYSTAQSAAGGEGQR